MTHLNTHGPPVQGGLEQIIRTIAGVALALLMIGLGFFNVRQWLAEGFVILALVAVCAEIIGFVMAVMIEFAVRARRWIAAGVCGLILTVCAGFNVIGFERAWDASMAQHMESARRGAQRDLDRARGEIMQKLADANSRIASYSHLLPGADTYRSRQAGMMAAWEAATMAARADAQKAQADLDAMAVVAAVEAPFAAWQVQLGGGFAELIKALGLWACGFGAAAAGGQRFQLETMGAGETPVETGPETALETPSPQAGNVVSLAERAKALRAQLDHRGKPMPFSAIGRALGCCKKHAWTLVTST